MRIATWNVNSVRQRIDHLVSYLKQVNPDIMCLQEIKTVEDNFPKDPLEDMGYNLAIHGQKTFNGVAILAKNNISDVSYNLPFITPEDNEDKQARYLEAIIQGNDNNIVRVASIYVPNGNPIDTAKYSYKLSFLERLITHAKTLLSYEETTILAGDYNIIPELLDAKYPEKWYNDALFTAIVRDKYRELLNLGFSDALRETTLSPDYYSFWDYRAGAFAKNNGIRIDHMLLSPLATDKLSKVNIDKDFRGLPKPSDHCPIHIDL